jgi:hypothetical protein
LRVRLPVNRRFAFKIGVEENIAAVDFCEVRTETLTRILREVRATAKEAVARKAAAGVSLAHEQFTWEHSAERAALCLRELQGKLPRRLQRRRREAEQAYRRFESARRLFLDRKEPPSSERNVSAAT